MRNLRLAYVGFASALALGANGCASTPPPAKLVAVRPVHTATPSPGSAAGNLYQQAVSAIERRDYARALDLLQAARDGAPQDARVLNAFGVVYDKLGRFDLSDRYYAQAQVADPGSPIVAENRAYSGVLQGKAPATALASRTAVAPSALPGRPAAPASTRVASAQAPAKPPAAPQPTRETALSQMPRLSLTALAVRTIPPAKPPELTPLPSTVSLAIHAAPAVPMQPIVGPPLQVTSIAAEPSLKAGSPASQAPLTQQPPPALKVSFPPAKPLTVLRAPASKEAALPAMTPLALKTAGPAMVVPAQSTRAALAVRPMQIADATTLRRVSLPTVQLPAPSPRELTSDRVQQDRSTVPIKTERVLHAAAAPAPPGLAHAAPVSSTRHPARARGGFIGRALMIVDASGSPRSANVLRAQLARRGWTVPAARPQTGAVRSQTTIRYAAAHAVVARALANSLRVPVRLERCARSCQGVSLILGADSRVASRTFRSGSGFHRLSQ